MGFGEQQTAIDIALVEEVESLRAKLAEARAWIAAKCTIGGCWKSRAERAEAENERLRQVLQGLYDYVEHLESRYSTWVLSRPSMAQMPPGAVELGNYVRAALEGKE